MTGWGFGDADTPSLHDLALDLSHDAITLAVATSTAGRRWRRAQYWLGGPATVTAAIAGASAIQGNTALSAGFALASAVLASLTTWLNPAATAESFLRVSREYAVLYARLDTLLVFDLRRRHDRSSTPEFAKAALVELREEMHRVRESSPEVPPWAFNPRRLPKLRLRREVLGSGDSDLLRGLRD